MQTTQSRASLLLSLFCALLTLGTVRAHAQTSHPTDRGDLRIAITYAASDSQHLDGTNFWPQGGALSLNARFYKGFGLAASGTGFHNNGDSTHAPLDLVTIAFGPSYTVHAGKRTSIFGEALLGEAHAFHTLVSTGSGPLPSLVYGTTDSANALALQTGGGVDFHLSHHLALRALQVDYLRTQIPNGSSNLQNNLRVAAGIVFH